MHSPSQVVCVSLCASLTVGLGIVGAWVSSFGSLRWAVMDILSSALIVSLVIAFFGAVPWFFSGIRNFSHFFLYLGTGALLYFALFDLLPEMIEAGGWTAIAVMLIVLGFFSWLHVRDRLHAHSGDGHPLSVLVVSMSLHTFSSGMLLVSSYDISETLVRGVFFSLVVHKAFEAMSVSSLLIVKEPSSKKIFLMMLLYGLSFPIGVALTSWARNWAGSAVSVGDIEMSAMIITSVALGSLLGCLINDFIIPTVQRLKQPRLEVDKL